MDINVDNGTAQTHSAKIVGATAAYTNISLSSISGSNTKGCSDANSICEGISSNLGQYATVSKRDGENISLLASYFEETDNQIANEMKN